MEGNFLIRNDTEHLKFSNRNEQPQKMFVVVRNTKSTKNNLDYSLKRGDIIKLGRVKFRVDSISGCKNDSLESDGQSLSLDSSRSEHDNSVEISPERRNRVEISPERKNKHQCKVCWGTEQSDTNPLLNSCKCDGSVRYIHYQCLKQWLK